MKSEKLRPVMLGGTGSDVGKSVLVAGLCRIFLQDGYNPAPFKAQNMALNSYVTADGLELGRAQAMQAEAAGIECLAEMNPILLKPIGDCTSQVVLNGKPIGNRTASDYFNQKGRDFLRQETHAAFDRLAAMYNPIVMEGAGSIAEINLMDLDLVNVPMARYADAPIILVADIRRGGVFASVYGSIMLQKPEDRDRIKGVIINQFRGDIRLFETGRHLIEELCGVPVLGVMPYLEDLHIEEEDSYFTKQHYMGNSSGKVNVAIVRLSHISNFTDFDPLEADPRANVFYTDSADAIAKSDIVILPGSKATISDLEEIRQNGVAQAIIDARTNGKTVIGICGGYQMMGRTISDPQGIEGAPRVVEGLGLLPIDTEITAEKLTRRIGFKWRGSDEQCQGYEIHMGKTIMDTGVQRAAALEDGTADGCVADDRCFGTYLHGLFDNACVVESVLGQFEIANDRHFDYKAFKNSQYDYLAEVMRKHIDIDKIYKIMGR